MAMDDIERFLRQVAQRRQQAQQQREAPPPSPVVQYVEPEPVEAVPVRDHDQLTRRHVDSAEEVQSRSSRMGQRERQADDATQRRLHATFDHAFGRLGGRSNQAATGDQNLPSEPRTDHNRSSLAEAIVQIFRSPTDIRNAIVLKEILDRPEHRWIDDQ